MNVVSPATVSASATFARASSATYWDYAGTLQTVLSDVLRFNWDRATNAFEGVLIEPAATNLLLNSATVTLQTRTVSAGVAYVMSFYGTGSVTLSGATAITLTGTGANVLKEHRFMAGSTSLTITPSGSVTDGQLEAGDDATSRIVTTGSPVTRAADVITGTGVFYSQFTDATAAYNAGTAYALGNVIQYGNRIYESLQAANTGHTPDTSPTWWSDTGPNNTFAMFDEKLTTRSTGLAGEQYVCLKMASSVDAVAALGMTNVASVHLIVGDGYTYANSVYNGANPTSAVLSGVRAGDVVTVAFNNTAGVGPGFPGYPVVAELIVGVLSDAGETVGDISGSFIDFSTKTTDDFGNDLFVERAYKKTLNCDILIQKSAFNATYELLLGLRARPTVWIASEDADYSSLAIVYGTLAALNLVVKYATESLWNVEILGLNQGTN